MLAARPEVQDLVEQVLFEWFDEDGEIHKHYIDLVAKISGSLVNFTSQDTVTSGGVLSADGGQFTLAPGDADGEDATLLFELTGETPLTVGFTGYWTCNG